MVEQGVRLVAPCRGGALQGEGNCECLSGRPVEMCMEDSGLYKRNVHEAALVGGATAFPKCRRAHVRRGSQQ